MGKINNIDGFMTSKEDILRAVSREKKILEKNVTGAPWDVAFEETKLSLLKRFEDRVKKILKSVLFAQYIRIVSLRTYISFS